MCLNKILTCTKFPACRITKNELFLTTHFVSDLSLQNFECQACTSLLHNVTNYDPVCSFWAICFSNLFYSGFIVDCWWHMLQAQTKCCTKNYRESKIINCIGGKFNYFLNFTITINNRDTYTLHLNYINYITMSKANYILKIPVQLILPAFCQMM